MGLTSLTRAVTSPDVKFTFSIYEAKARLSAVLRLVKQGKPVTITERGQPIARIVPFDQGNELEQKIADLRASGILGPAASGSWADVQPGPARPGAVDRFLQDRE